MRKLCLTFTVSILGLLSACNSVENESSDHKHTDQEKVVHEKVKNPVVENFPNTQLKEVSQKNEPGIARIIREYQDDVDYFKLIKKEYVADFSIWGISSEGARASFEIGDQNNQYLTIKIFGSIGITTVALEQNSDQLIETTEYFDYTELSSETENYNVKIDQEGDVHVFDSDNAYDKYYSCLLNKILDYSYNDNQGVLNISCVN